MEIERRRKKKKKCRIITRWLCKWLSSDALGCQCYCYIQNSDALAIDIMSNTTREVEHIVFLKLRKDISTEDFQVLKGALFDLKKIPGVKYLSFGENFTERAPGFTHGIIVRFESKEAGEAYQTHDLHLKVLDLLKNALDKSNGTPVMAMDYEVIES